MNIGIIYSRSKQKTDLWVNFCSKKVVLRYKKNGNEVLFYTLCAVSGVTTRFGLTSPLFLRFGPHVYLRSGCCSRTKSSATLRVKLPHPLTEHANGQVVFEEHEPIFMLSSIRADRVSNSAVQIDKCVLCSCTTKPVRPQHGITAFFKVFQNSDRCPTNDNDINTRNRSCQNSLT